MVLQLLQKASDNSESSTSLNIIESVQSVVTCKSSTSVSLVCRGGKMGGSSGLVTCTFFTGLTGLG